MKNFNEIKSHIRDIKMNILLSKDYKISQDIKKQSDGLQFLRRNNKLIRYTKSLGGVLTGSRALKCYKINDVPVLERQTKDWDFIITRDMAFKICNKFNIKYNLVDTVLTINSSFITWSSAYSATIRIMPQDVQLIIQDELPEYTQIDKTKLADLSYILNQKIEIIEDCINNNNNYRHHDTLDKHEQDLLEFIIKFNGIYPNVEKNEL
jgi:hypothetical protein